MALQVLKAAVVAPYLLLGWTVYAGLLPVTGLWGAAALSVLPGRSFVAFAQVRVAAPGEGEQHERSRAPCLCFNV